MWGRIASAQGVGAMNKDNVSKDKEYIVDTKIDATLTEEEIRKLRKQSGSKPAHGRQDIFVDRRDPLAQKKVQPDRRKNKRDRRDLDDAL